MRLLHSGVVAALLAILLLAHPAGAIEPPPTVDQAVALQSSGQFEKAASAWRSIVDADPNNGRAIFNLGYCLHVTGSLDEALVMHQRATAFDEFRAIALYNLACAYALTDRPDAALDTLARSKEAGFGVSMAHEDADFDSLRDDPRFHRILHDATVRGRIGAALGGASDWMRDVTPTREELQATGQSIKMRAQVGIMRLMLDERFRPVMWKIAEWRDARKQSRSAKEPDRGSDRQPTAAPVEKRYSLNDARRLQQDESWNEAAVAYGFVLKHEPDNATAAFGRTYCLHMAGDYDEAIKAHTFAATFERLEGIALYNLGCAYALTKRTDEAFKALHASSEAGFDVERLLDTDSDLDGLRSDPRFELLRAEVGADI